MSLSAWVDRAISHADRWPRAAKPNGWEWALMYALLDAGCKLEGYLHPRAALDLAPERDLDAIETRAIRGFQEVMAPP